jgi:chemotaxis signal transduction protein
MITLQKNQASNSSTPAMIFTIAGQTLALPLSVVLKVIATPPNVSVDHYNNPLIYLDNQPIALLNLHSRLARLKAHSSINNSNTTHAMETGEYLLIASVQGSPYGIFIDNSPTLLDLPFNKIQLLPETYRQALGGAINHVCLMPHPEPLSKILLLNLPPLLQAVVS